jgi:hypothetical protein
MSQKQLKNTGFFCTRLILTDSQLKMILKNKHRFEKNFLGENLYFLKYFLKKFFYRSNIFGVFCAKIEYLKKIYRNFFLKFFFQNQIRDF